MKRIYKYPIQITDEQIIQMPENAEILHVNIQHNQAFIWAMIDPEEDEEDVEIRVYGTGHPVQECKELSYLGTVFIQNGDLVFHVFKVG